jgi:hypothetical protein
VTALDVLALFIAAQFLEALTAAVLRFRATQKAAERAERRAAPKAGA